MHLTPFHHVLTLSPEGGDRHLPSTVPLLRERCSLFPFPSWIKQGTSDAPYKFCISACWFPSLRCSPITSHPSYTGHPSLHKGIKVEVKLVQSRGVQSPPSTSQWWMLCWMSPSIGLALFISHLLVNLPSTQIFSFLSVVLLFRLSCPNLHV